MDLAEEFANILREEIDREIITEARITQLLGEGWTMVRLPDPDRDGIGAWMQENMQEDWRAFASCWLFESADDATLFTLRWL